jgi:hypothetical protein
LHARAEAVDLTGVTFPIAKSYEGEKAAATPSTQAETGRPGKEIPPPPFFKGGKADMLGFLNESPPEPDGDWAEKPHLRV